MPFKAPETWIAETEGGRTGELVAFEVDAVEEARLVDLHVAEIADMRTADHQPMLRDVFPACLRLFQAAEAIAAAGPR